MKNIKDRLCFSTLGCTGRSMDEILALCKKYGIGKLEFRGVGGVLDNRQIPDFSDENIEKTKAKMAEAGVRPLVLGTSCSFHDPAKLEGALEEGRACIDVARKLGAGGIRVFGNRMGKNPSESVARVCEALGALCGYAGDSGVKVLLEVHGDFNTESALRPVCDALSGCPDFGLIWDVGHTADGYAEKQMDFYECFAPLIRHVHMKDQRGGVLCLPGDGDIDCRAIADGLLEAGYDGAFSLEWEKKWHPELPPMEDALERYVKLLAE